MERKLKMYGRPIGRAEEAKNAMRLDFERSKRCRQMIDGTANTSTIVRVQRELEEAIKGKGDLILGYATKGELL